MNKILVLLLSISMLLILFSGCGNFKENSTTNESTSSTTDEQNQPIEPSPASDFEYQINSPQTGILINKYIGTSEHVIIPSYIDDLPVLSLREI